MEAIGVTDMRCIDNVGVFSGAHGRDQMQPQPHTHLLSSIANLPPLLFGR